VYQEAASSPVHSRIIEYIPSALEWLALGPKILPKPTPLPTILQVKHHKLTLHSACVVQCFPAKLETVSIKTRSDEATTLFREQFRNPSEVFSVLLIIGGDVVVKAIAQLSGRKYTLVAFSFGWVAYSFSALMSAFGDGTFMPRPDSPGSVIEVGSRNKKTNDSWVIGRLIRDLERQVENNMKSWQTVPAIGEKPSWVYEGDTGLIISIYEVSHIAFFEL
jgi:hypothetical protein